MHIDYTLFSYFNSAAGLSSWLDGTIVFCAVYLPFFLIALFLGALVYLRRPLQDRIRALAVAVLSGTALEFILVPLIRVWWARPRPFAAHKVHQLFPETGFAFPSLHATLLFALAMAAYTYNKHLGIALFIGAAVVSCARVMGGVHYPLDILAGALLGTSVAYVCVYILRKLQV